MTDHCYVSEKNQTFMFLQSKKPPEMRMIDRSDGGLLSSTLVKLDTTKTHHIKTNQNNRILSLIINSHFTTLLLSLHIHTHTRTHTIHTHAHIIISIYHPNLKLFIATQTQPTI
ncbi:hypothetical protein L1987_64760 [Smallanthus sonchifolius]|uniref:Uncharacterized protein n=1 Tax=Smallanthus sonchifolius TaxID=185202 RepID=A0ACB9BSQ4_9ASTR|nr:hypothetical protein L1987_64760 [Smallanthus sonchifolius]